ncbi:MAG: hypothetical protein ACR2M0_11230 [Chloroflexia bacterium]
MTTIRLKHAEDIVRSLSEQEETATSVRGSVAYIEYDEQELADTFDALARDWQEETGMLSVVQKKAMHPAYQRIIGLGRPAIPLLLRELKERPSHWFWALDAVTGENPVPPGADPTEALEAWPRWGKERGYLD